MRRAPLALISLAAACDSPTAPLPPGAVRFDPPAVYERWWALTKECSGLPGRLSAINFYQVPGVRTFQHRTGPVTGYWTSSGNRIVLAGDALHWGDVVRHEMLHALLRRGGHPRATFIGKCGGVVICTDTCLTAETAPEADPETMHVLPAQLEVSVDVEPHTPGSAIMDGHFMMVIRARNPMARSVIVDLPRSGDAGPPGSFGYRTVHASGFHQFDVRADAVEVTRFGPGEEKRYIFDFRNREGDTRYDKPPRTYRFEGRYGDVWALNPPVRTVQP